MTTMIEQAQRTVQFLRKQFSSNVEVYQINKRIIIGPKNKPTFRFRLESSDGLHVEHLSLETQYGLNAWNSNPWDFTFHKKYTMSEAIALIRNTYNVR